MKLNKKTITEFLANEYRDFSLYTIENRALPSVIDGFKPVHRKIAHGASSIWKSGNEKALKVYQLSGMISNSCQYHHGDCLSYDTEIVMADGTYITIGDWCDNYPDTKFEVISYDESISDYVSGIGHSPRIGSITYIEYEIEMENGDVFKCTGNHPFLTKRGWIKAEDLLCTDDIISFYDIGG